MQCVLTDEPTVEPVTLAEIKAHCEVTRDDQDDMLTAMAVGARQWCEEYTHRAFLEQTWTLTLDSFEYITRIPRPRLISVDSITYTGTDAATATLDASNYTVTGSEPGMLVVTYGMTWPNLLPNTPGVVSITFTAGYGTAASSVPQQIKDAVLMLTAHRYDHRSPVEDAPTLVEAPMTVKSMLNPYVAGDYR